MVLLILVSTEENFALFALDDVIVIMASPKKMIAVFMIIFI